MALDKALAALRLAEKHLANAKETHANVAQTVAELACPFKVGDLVLTNRGLGKDGLQVFKVTSPQYPHDGNLWAVDTYALTKTGEVSRRVVGLDQYHAERDGIRPKT